MPQVLRVTTLELCHPLMLVILMIANDPTFSGHGNVLISNLYSSRWGG
ncbi:MAG TPA: hypothetical protein VKA25_02320 [Gemmatimonadales bacterium]|nr:hypothetical protein [Gemmatimonadales bacterium]